MKLDYGATVWLNKTAAKNYWRVHRWYDLDDLVQDGHMCHAIVVNRYTDVTKYEHMMGLFKVTYLNHIHDLASARTKQQLEWPLAALTDTTVDYTKALEDLMVNNRSFFTPGNTLMSQMPEPVRQLMEILSSEAGRKRLRSVYRRKKGGVRETLNERFSRIIGVEADYRGIVESYLSNA